MACICQLTTTYLCAKDTTYGISDTMYRVAVHLERDAQVLRRLPQLDARGVIKITLGRVGQLLEFGNERLGIFILRHIRGRLRGLRRRRRGTETA